MSARIGSGEQSYHYDGNWAKLPANMEFGTTHGVVEDSRGRILIHHTGAPSIVIFDADGNYLESWGDEYAGGAHGMHLSEEDGEEFLYLSTTSLGFVAKTTLSGEEILRIETPPREDIYDDDHRFVPTETTVGPDGTIYIADGYGQPWVHRYSQAGQYLDSFGGLGNGLGQLDNPHGIMLDTRESELRIAVSDRKNARIQYFTLGGKPISVTEGDLRFPCTSIQWNDYLYIPDLYSRLTILDGNDTLVAHLGDWPDCWKRDGWPNLPKSEWIPGKYSSPHDLEVDGAGNIYVVEWLSEGTGKVTKLSKL